MTTQTEQVEATKRCSKCVSEKLLEEFNLSSRSKDGRQVKCKQCEANYRIANRDRIKQRKAKYHISNRDTVLKRLKEYRSKNAARNREREKSRYEKIKLDPEKYSKYRTATMNGRRKSRLLYPSHTKANSKVLSAIRSGKIIRPNLCSSCGRQCKPEAHHDSYDESQWLVVRWLCRKCHCEHHRKYPHLSV